MNLSVNELVKAIAYNRLWNVKDIITKEFIASEEGRQRLQEFKERTIQDVIFICQSQKREISNTDIDMLVNKVFADALGVEI